MLYLIIVTALIVHQVAVTCVIVRATKDRVFVGADSLVREDKFKVLANGQTEHSLDIRKGCKIFQVNDILFATTGYANEDVINDIRINLEKAVGSLAYRADVAIEGVETRVTDELSRLWKLSPSSLSFQKLYPGQQVFEFFLVGRENGKIKVIYRRLRPITKTDAQFSLFLEGADFPDGNHKIQWPLTIMAGNYDKIPQIKEEFWTNADPAKRMEELIEVQAKADTEKVGGPVDIIELSTTGVKLIKRKPLCI